MTDFNHEEDVVYGYKDGMALVMDVYTPRDPRVDAGIIWVTAGGWRSNYDWRHTLMQRSEGSAADNLARCLLDAGYVVFATAHSSQPRYSIDDIRQDMPRAVRFVRHNAARFRIDAERLGIIGFSSGGHVSLLTATAPPPPDPEAADPVDRGSSRVQAVTAFFAPTYLLNYGAEGVSIQDHLNAYIQTEQGHEYNAIFAFFVIRKTRSR